MAQRSKVKKAKKKAVAAKPAASKKILAKKTASKKASSKKTAPKKQVKKVAAKKTALKKPAPKKATAKKQALKKQAPVKKSAVKKQPSAMIPVPEKTIDQAANINDQAGLQPNENDNKQPQVNIEDPIRAVDQHFFAKATAKQDPNHKMQLSSGKAASRAPVKKAWRHK